MSELRKMKRKALKKKLKNMGVQHPSSRVKDLWKDYNAGRKI